MVTQLRGRPAWLVPIGAGLIVGATIAAVDNFAFNGEVSPIVVIAMLLSATTTAGLTQKRLGWVTAGAVWVWIPGAHLVKRILGVPDTLRPNSYKSILMLAVFSLAVAAAGTGCGLLLRRLAAKKSCRMSTD
jgi:hypothetical protein